MPLVSTPPRRFLLNASVLMVLLLSAWWFALKGPLLLALYTGVRIPISLINGAVTIEPSGDWSFRIPVQDSPAEVLRQTGLSRIDSLDFTVPAADIVTFTLGFPLFWAVALASPSRRIRPLMLGSLLQLAIGVLSIVVFAEVAAYNALAQIHSETTLIASWSRALADRLVTAVIPFAAPIITAVSLDPELRRQTLGSTGFLKDQANSG